MGNKNGKIVAVWGSGGVGKTTLSVKLALEFAKMQRESLIILTDVNAPDMKVILPFEEELKSMGQIWMQDVDEDDIYNVCVTTKSEYICLMGYTQGENAFTYSDCTKENVYKVFEEAKSIVDYVIVDCVPNLAYNMHTAVALETADYIIRMGEATRKSFSFFDSNMQLLADGRYSKEHIRVLGKVKSEQAVEVAKNYLGCTIELPYSESINAQFMEGKLFSPVSDAKYEEGLKRIVEQIKKEE